MVLNIWQLLKYYSGIVFSANETAEKKGWSKRARDAVIGGATSGATYKQEER